MSKEPILNLQDIVDAYEDPAVLIDDDYRIICANQSYRQIYSLQHETMPCSSSNKIVSTRPQNYCYSVSHRYSRSCDQEGESCPLQQAKQADKNQRVLHIHHTQFGEVHVDVSLYPIHSADGKNYFLEVMKTVKHASPIAGHQGMVGKSKEFNRLLSFINRVAGHDVSVLLLGESGSGKELVAHAIHQDSARHSSACVTVECSGLSESLFESELFGHEKGAFTGAVFKKKGLVEEAEGGTLFLDEIGDIPLSLQVKLLRLIETRTFRSVGGVEQKNSNFRLICATHKDLKSMVKKGLFREDLYYRISTFPIRLPTLRERRSDIPLLVETILKRISKSRTLTVSEPVMDFFSRYNFPGNIRELRNILEYARVMADDDEIELEHLPDEIKNNKESSTSKESSNQSQPAMFSLSEVVPLEQCEQQYLQWLSKNYQGDNKSLADKLGVSERTLYRKIKSIV